MPTQVSSEQNQTTQFCLASPHLPQRQLKPCFPHSLCFLGGSPRDPHKPDLALASGHGVSNFETGLLPNVQFRALVQLPTSCPNFLGGEIYLRKRNEDSVHAIDGKHPPSQASSRVKGTYLFMSRRRKAKWSWLEREGQPRWWGEAGPEAKDPGSLPGMSSVPKQGHAIMLLCIHSFTQSFPTDGSATLCRFCTDSGGSEAPKTKHPQLGNSRSG